VNILWLRRSRLDATVKMSAPPVRGCYSTYPPQQGNNNTV